MNLSLSGDEAAEPVTKGDLLVFGEQLERDLTGKALRFGIGVALSTLLLAMSGAWYASSWRGQVEHQVDRVTARVERMDELGTRGLGDLKQQIDSLRLEMRYMPSRIVSELERRGR